MSFFTRCLLLICFAVLLGASARAQTVPVWVNARAVGTTNTRQVMAVDAAGNTYATGYFTGTAIVGGTTLTSQGNYDAFVAKYTPAGALVWVYAIASPGFETVYGIAVDIAGNAYVSGTSTTSVTLSPTLSLAAGNRLFVLRLSPQGVPDWARQSLNIGSGTGIGVDATGHVYVAGFFQTSFAVGATTLTVPAAYGPNATFLLRLTAATGAVESLSAMSFYPTNVNTSFAPGLAVASTGAVCVLQLFNGQIVVGTSLLTSAGLSDALLIRYTAQGAVDWVQQIAGAGTEALSAAAMDPAGNVYAAGYANGTTTFGATTTSTSTGGHDGYLAKYSALGALQWVQRSGGPTFDGWYGIALDGAGSPYLVGSFTGMAQFGASTLTSAGNGDVVVAAYTPQGQVRWAQQAGGAGSEDGLGIGVDGRGDAYVNGTLRDVCAFGLLTVTPAMGSATGPTDNFLARLGSSVLTTATTKATAIGLYPVPATEVVYVARVAVGSPVRVLNARGQVVRQELAALAGAISVRGLPPGIYTVLGTDAAGQACIGKIVVQ